MAEKQQVFEKYLRCHICFETFKDPVSLGCHHSFCQTCLSKFWEQAMDKNCAVCKRKSSKDKKGINFSLKELADSFAGRLKLDNNPEEGKEMVCSKHARTPVWFCVDEDRAVCDDCQNPTQHATHTVIPLEEAVQDMKGKLKSDLDKMQDNLKKCTDTETVYKDMVQHTKHQLATTERSIKKVFEQLHQFLKEEEEARLRALREEEEQKGKMIGREMKTLQEQIQTLKDSIQHVENDLKQNSVPFLKDYQSTKSRAQCTLRDPQLLSGALINVAKHLGNLKFSVCEKLVETVEYHPMVFDPNATYCFHSLSNDLASVRETKNKQQQQLNNPERFKKYGIVLGSEGFTSGKHCWEVQVGDRSRWTLGVAKESVERKGETFLHPEDGLWTVKKSYDKYKVSSEILSLETTPQRVRVQLDYERGEVSFYDPTDMSHIYTYKDSFRDMLFPFFCTEGDESETSLQVCPLRVSLNVKNI